MRRKSNGLDLGLQVSCRFHVGNKLKGGGQQKSRIDALRVKYNLRDMIRRGLLILCILGLFGCQAGPHVGAGGPAAVVLETPSPRPRTETSRPVVVFTQPATMVSPRAASETLPSPDLTPTSTESITPTLTSPPTRVLWPPCSPLQGHTVEELFQIVSAPYAPPPPGKEERHHGVDFSYYRRGDRASIEGVPVQAILPGTVVMALEGSFPYGNVVIIETPEGLLPAELAAFVNLPAGASLYSLYAHLGQVPAVDLGTSVTACQVIGEVGKSGNAGVAHLHLETRTGPPGVTFLEMGYYLAEVGPEARAAYVRWRTGGEFSHFDPMLIFQPGP